MLERDITRTPEHTAAVEKAQRFVQGNIIPAREGKMCVDGRYPQATEDSGRAAIPGGTLGDVMALMAVSSKHGLGLTPRECFERVYQAVTSTGVKFYMHTDEHAIPGKPDSLQDLAEDKALIGCGHGNKATNPDLAKMYGVEAEAMVEMITLAKERAASGDPNMVMTELHGPHREKGVLRISGMEKTVNHSDSQEQYFVYDVDRHQQEVQKLVEQLGIPGVTYENFMAAADMQTEATLKLLAGGMPLMDVDLRFSIPTVMFMGTVAA